MKNGIVTHTWEGTMCIGKAFKSNGKFDITRPNYILNLEILKLIQEKNNNK